MSIASVLLDPLKKKKKQLSFLSIEINKTLRALLQCLIDSSSEAN